MTTLRILSSQLNNTATNPPRPKLRVLSSSIEAKDEAPKNKLRIFRSEIVSATAGITLRVISSAISADQARAKLRVLSSSLTTEDQVSAGANLTAVEPWSTVTLVGTDLAPADAVRGWKQLFGTPANLIGTGATRTYEAPPSVINRDLVFEYSVGDLKVTVTHTVLAVTERVVQGGVEVPLRLLPVGTAPVTTPPSGSSTYPDEFYPDTIYPA